jgi:DNA-binding response OmpR family regulator
MRRRVPDAPSNPSRVPRVAIVEDDRPVLEALRILVSKWGMAVVALQSFEAARTMLEAGDPPDALVVDVRLGMFNGLQLAYLAKQRNPGIVVIAMSGYDDDTIRKEAAAAGAVFLAKPIDFNGLRRKLSTIQSTRPAPGLDPVRSTRRTITRPSRRTARGAAARRPSR